MVAYHKYMGSSSVLSKNVFSVYPYCLITQAGPPSAIMRCRFCDKLLVMLFSWSMCYEFSCAQSKPEVGVRSTAPRLEEQQPPDIFDTPPSPFMVYHRTPLRGSPSASPVGTTAMAPATAPLVPPQVSSPAARISESAQAPSPIVPANAPGP